MRMANKRFFKPLVPGFHSHLTIPVVFFLKYIEGTNENHTAKLRSDASMITWEVKIEDGKKLTEEEENNLGKIPKKKNRKREAESSSLDPSCFLANILPSSLRYDTLTLPKSFVRANGLETSCGGEIVLMNEKSKSWPLVLKQKLSGTTYVRRGWRRFCIANGLKTGGVYTFKLIQRGRTPALRLSSTESESEERNIGELEKIQRKKPESSSLDPSCFVANISRATLRYDTLCFPVKFSRENGLETRSGEEIVLMNEKGGTWKLTLKRKRSCGTMYITQGWRSFCSANGLKAGSSFTFKLIKKGGALVLRLSPKETEKEEDCSSEANEIESLSTEPESDEESSQDERKIKKHRSTWKASSSQKQNRFVTLTLRSFNLEKYILYLPVRFTRNHRINEETKMTLLDKNGAKWSTDLRSEETSDRIRLVGGWQEFFKANCVKTGESIIVKLIWEGDNSCALRFCSKVKHETI
ncbi:B3 domain-containing protein REM14 [Hirschfeldia incana]|nr:B3 domain-containing protein REM14 [Hirschfeldia incana]